MLKWTLFDKIWKIQKIKACYIIHSWHNFVDCQTLLKTLNLLRMTSLLWVWTWFIDVEISLKKIKIEALIFYAWWNFLEKQQVWL